MVYDSPPLVPERSFTCPDCQTVITAPLAVAAGACWVCDDFTGPEAPADVSDDAMAVTFGATT